MRQPNNIRLEGSLYIFTPNFIGIEKCIRTLHAKKSIQISLTTTDCPSAGTAQRALPIRGIIGVSASLLEVAFLTAEPSGEGTLLELFEQF